MKKRLRDIAEIRIGYQFRGKVTPDPTSDVRVVQIKDIDSDLRVRVSDLTTVRIDKPEPYLTQAGDVLCALVAAREDGLHRVCRELCTQGARGARKRLTGKGPQVDTALRDVQGQRLHG